MSNEKFTPGEWVTRPGNTTVLDKHSNPIAMVYRAEYYRSKEESFANAALIKAAPGMYERLKGVRCFLWTCLQYMQYTDPLYEQIEYQVKMMDEVLKKARGES